MRSIFLLFNCVCLSYCEGVRKLWVRYPSTLLSIIFLVIASAYGWLDARVQKPVLGVTDTKGFEQSVVLEVTNTYGIVLEDGRTIRLAGITFPPTEGHASTTGCLTTEPLALTRELLLNKMVFFEPIENDTDRYGRTQRYAWVQDRLINHELVLQGMATVVADTEEKNEYTEDLLQAERAARLQKKGVWRTCPAQ